MPIRFLRPQTLSALFFSVFLASVLLALATPLWAQKDAGAIVGLVRDPSGAVVTGAKVTVTDVDRGIQLTLSTNDQGEYVASPLRIGRYSVTVEKQGFKKAVAGPVQVNIQDRVGVDLKLQPGVATEVVEVTAQRPQLETDTSELGQVVDNRRINALPLNGRNYAQLALLGTGVAPAEPGPRVETSSGFSANGARSLQNNFLLDGIDNNANLGDVLNGSAYVVQPSVDAIAEFKVETNSYSAEFGRGRRPEGAISARRPARRCDLRHDRGRRRRGDSGQEHLFGDAFRRRQAGYGDAPETRARLHLCRQEFRRRPWIRLYSRGFGSLAGAARELRG